MSPKPTLNLGNGNPGVTITRNLFEVGVLTSRGLKLVDARREGPKVVFVFKDPRAAVILAKHRNGELMVNSREFVAAINNARDVCFAL